MDSDDIFTFVGAILCKISGCLLCLLIIGALLLLACKVWIIFSGEFRGICRAESLIFEYKKNRKAFLEWMKEKGSKQGNGT